jgi:putative ABC transport system permease protein
MALTAKLPPGVRRLFRLPQSRERLLRDLDDELAAHLAMRVDELRASGLSEHDAEAEARRRFGDPDEYRAYAERRAARKARRLRVGQWLAEWAHDVAHAWRQTRKAPGFTAIAVLTLALGIGANTAIFSVVRRLLLAPLPVPNGDRIVMPVTEDPFGFKVSVGADVVEAWRARTHTVESIAGASEDAFGVSEDGAIDTMPMARITANFLPVLGVRPVLGRNFTAAEERQDPATVVIVSDELWRRTFGGRADVLGATVRYEGRPLTVIGVMPPRFAVPMSLKLLPQLWTPIPLDRAGMGSGANPGPGVFVTLRPGVSAEDATRELQAVVADLPAAGPGRTFVRPGGRPAVRVLRAQDFLDPRETRAVQVLFVAVGALLLIACANVANLLLARAWTRQREFAVRASLGAGRGRLARQVLAESLVLALLGGALGVGVAWGALELILALRPPTLEHLASVRLEPAVLLWSLGVSLATGVLFGCAPALLAGARQVGDVLRNETRGGSAGVAAGRVRSALIVLEIAASLVLLVGSGLMVRSFAALQRVPLGFEPRGLVYVEALMGGPRNRDRVPALRAEVLRRIRALPGVTDAGIGIMPGKGWVNGGGIEAETDRAGHTTRVPTIGSMLVAPDFFGVARLRIIEGRLMDSTLQSTTRPFRMSPEVVVNRALARRLWPGCPPKAGGCSALGMHLRDAPSERPGAPAQPPGAWSTVVGVVDDTRIPDMHGDVATLQVFTLFPAWLSDVPFLVRASTSGDVAAPAIKRAVASTDPTIYVRQVISGDTYLREGLAPTRFAMALLTAFAVIALALAAVGLYGVIAYAVRQRTREIGVRIALGATPGAVMRLALGGGLRLAALGVAVGAVTAAATTRVLASMLYAVSPADPATFAAITGLVASIALVASYVPARRALHVDPTETLRAD